MLITLCCILYQPLTTAMEIISRPSATQSKQLQEINPKIVVALGKQADETLEELADTTLPHPHAALKHGDKIEVSRKALMLR